MMMPATLAAAAFLAILHIFAGRIKVLHVLPRSRWLSAAAGASVAYVFVHLLPELAARQQYINEAGWQAFSYIEHHAYVVALVGFAAFYGLEQLARRARKRRAGTDHDPTQSVKHDADAPSTPPAVFWLHIISFACYNAVIGYLLVHRETPGLANLAMFTLAMGLHFVVNDYSLRDHHQHRYDRIGRWLLAASILAGWLIGIATAMHEGAMLVLFALLAGGVVLNVIKEELPAERGSRFFAFAIGAGGYAALLLFVASYE